jgi:glycyl-tRNA synthetase alpha chain
VRWSKDMTYRQVRFAEEQQFSAYNFDWADPIATRKMFDLAEAEAQRLLKAYAGLRGDEKKRFPILGAYDMVLKCSHLFNVLDARGVISTTERAAIIGRVRQIACKVAAAWLEQRSPAALEVAGVQA